MDTFYIIASLVPRLSSLGDSEPGPMPDTERLGRVYLYWQYFTVSFSPSLCR